MNIDQILDNIINYAESNPAIAAAVGLLGLYILFKRPKTSLIVVIIVIFWGVVFKMISRLFETGIFE